MSYWKCPLNMAVCKPSGHVCRYCCEMLCKFHQIDGCCSDWCLAKLHEKEMEMYDGEDGNWFP